ncbi:hypothetical protein PFISCL1PPCAC_2624, partial [Pristionchus fissidentatus]
GDIKASNEMISPEKSSGPEKSNPPSEHRKDVLSPSAEMMKDSSGGKKLSSELVGGSSELPKEPNSGGVISPSAEALNAETSAEQENKRKEQQKTWQQVKHKPSAEIIEENWRKENLGQKSTSNAKAANKEASQIKPKPKKEFCASSENIIVMLLLRIAEDSR